MGLIKLTDLPLLDTYSDDCVLIVVRGQEIYRVSASQLPDMMVSLDETLTDETKAASAKAVGDALKEIREVLADLQYEPIVITYFDIKGFDVYLMGKTVSGLELNWTTSKVPTKLVLDGKELDPETTSFVDTGMYTSEKQWVLTVTDERGAMKQAYVEISFANYVRYGTAPEPDDVTSEFVLSLGKQLRKSMQGTYQFNAGETDHIWFAVPSRMGTPTFAVGGFTGGFSLAATLDLTNEAGYTEPYDVWRSDQKALGETSVVVK